MVAVQVAIHGGVPGNEPQTLVAYGPATKEELCPMGRPALVSEEDLLRARSDPAFRHRMVQDHLELLLDTLKKLRNTRPSAGGEQIREGAEMAVRLADILHKIAESGDH